MKAALRRCLAYAAITALALGCSSEPDRPDKGPPPPPPRPAASASASASAPAGDASSTPPAASAAPILGAGSPTGAWEGSFDAKKGAVEMPPKVKDKARAADNGKVASGPGKLTLTIGANGEINGKATGSLGEATVTGRSHEDAGLTILGAAWMPVDPATASAMSGVLTGTVEGDTIHARVRVAGPDALVVREALFDLKRAK